MPVPRARVQGVGRVRGRRVVVGPERPGDVAAVEVGGRPLAQDGGEVLRADGLVLGLDVLGPRNASEEGDVLSAASSLDTA